MRLELCSTDAAHRPDGEGQEEHDVGEDQQRDLLVHRLHQADAEVDDGDGDHDAGQGVGQEGRALDALGPSPPDPGREQGHGDRGQDGDERWWPGPGRRCWPAPTGARRCRRRSTRPRAIQRRISAIGATSTTPTKASDHRQGGPSERPEVHGHRPAAGAAADPGGRAGAPGLRLAVDEHERQGDQHQRQHRGPRGVEPGPVRAVDDPGEALEAHGGDGAEVGQHVEGDEQRSGRGRRPHLAQRQAEGDLGRRAPERPGDLLVGGVEAAEGRGDGEVHEGVRDRRQHQGGAPEPGERRPPRDPCEGGDVGGEREGEGQHDPPHPAAGEVGAGDEERPGDADDEGGRGDHHRQPDRPEGEVERASAPQLVDHLGEALGEGLHREVPEGSAVSTATSTAGTTTIGDTGSPLDHRPRVRDRAPAARVA